MECRWAGCVCEVSCGAGGEQRRGTGCGLGWKLVFLCQHILVVPPRHTRIFISFLLIDF